MQTGKGFSEVRSPYIFLLIFNLSKFFPNEDAFVNFITQITSAKMRTVPSDNTKRCYCRPFKNEIPNSVKIFFLIVSVLESSFIKLKVIESPIN